MRSAGWLVLASAVLLLAVAWLLLGHTDPVRMAPEDATATAARESAPAPEHAAPGQILRDIVREPVASAPALPAGLALEHEFEFTLSCLVVSADGLPVRDVQLAFAPAGGTPQAWPQRTGADGTTILRWRGRQQTMEIDLGILPAGSSDARVPAELRRLQVQAGATQRWTLLGEPGGAVEVLEARQLLAAESAGPVAGLPECAHPGVSFADRMLLRLDPEPVLPTVQQTDPQRVLSNALARTLFAQISAAHTVRIDQEIVLQLATARAAHGRVAPAEPVLANAATRSHAFQAVLLLHLSGRRPAAPRAGIEGRLLDARATPVAGATVWCQPAAGGEALTATSDEQGRFSFSSLQPGRWRMRAGGSDAGIAEGEAVVAAQAKTSVDLTLQRAAMIAGRAFGADGTALHGWRIVYTSIDEQWVDACTVQESGEFVLPNLPGAGRLELFRNDGPSLPVAMLPCVLAGSLDVRFDLREIACTGGVRLTLDIPPAWNAESTVWIWHLPSGRGIAMAPDAEGAFELGGLGVGSYRIDVRVDGMTLRELGPLWVDGKSQLDLGRVTQPAPARVRFPTQGGERAAVSDIELYLRRADCDVRANGDHLHPGTRFAVAAGHWLCLYRSSNGRLHGCEFLAREGATVDVPLQAAGAERAK